MFGAGLFGALARLYLLLLALLIVAGLFATAFLMRLAWQHKLMTAALLGAALAGVLWLDWRDRRRWQRLLAAAADHQSRLASAEGWPLSMPLAAADLAAVLQAAGLGGRPGARWRKAAAAALREGGARLLAERLADRCPDLESAGAGRAAAARAYAQALGADLRWAPYLHAWLERRFEVGTSLPETEQLILQAARRLRWER